MKKKSTILFAYVTPENKAHIQTLSKQMNQSSSAIINELVAAHRDNKKAKIKKNDIPGYVKRAKSWLEKNKETTAHASK